MTNSGLNTYGYFSVETMVTIHGCEYRFSYLRCQSLHLGNSLDCYSSRHHIPSSQHEQWHQLPDTLNHNPSSLSSTRTVSNDHPSLQRKPQVSASFLASLADVGKGGRHGTHVEMDSGDHHRLQGVKLLNLFDQV